MSIQYILIIVGLAIYIIASFTHIIGKCKTRNVDWGEPFVTLSLLSGLVVMLFGAILGLA